MKRWILPTFFVWTLVGAVALAAYSGKPSVPQNTSTTQKGKIAWETNFEAGMKEARDSGKPALVVFGTKTCTYCKEMDATTWRDAKVAGATRGWIPIKVDGDARTDLLAAYGVRGFPTALMIQGNGKPFAATEGYVEAGEFLTLLESARKKLKS